MTCFARTSTTSAHVDTDRLRLDRALRATRALATRRVRAILHAGITGLLVSTVVAGAAAQSAAVTLDGPGAAQRSFSLEELKAMPTDTVRMSLHGAPWVLFRGVRLTELMRSAGAAVESLRVGRQAWIVVAQATDGYVVTFSAAELDPQLGPTRAWLVWEANGAPLPRDEGPLRIVVSTDSKPARSARRITHIRIMAAPVSPS